MLRVFRRGHVASLAGKIIAIGIFLGIAGTGAAASAAELQNGVPATGLSAASGATLNYTFVVPAGVTSLTFQISGGSGDADLYVKFGSAPTTGSYDCRPYVGGNNETCAMTPTAGTWYVMLRAYSSFSGVSLVASYTTGGGTTALQKGVPVTGLAAATGVQLNYTLAVPAGASNLSFQISGGSGDADLYVKFGSAPTTGSYDCRPYVAGNNETCVMPNATAGTWYVMVRAYSSFANVSLVGTYTIGGPNAPPTANAGLDQTVTSGAAVSLPGSGDDTDGTVTGYAWTQITPPTPVVTLTNANTATASFTAPTVSVSTVFTFRLTVTDNLGATGFDEVNVTVNPGGGTNVPPTANAGLDQTVTSGAAVSLPGSGDDTDGTVTGYAWTKTVGPTVTLSGANTATASFTAPTVSVTTVFTFRLTVTDNLGATGFDEVNVTVNPGGGGGNVLTNGVPATGLSAASGATLNYTFVVPAGVTSLTFQISGGSGDADLYVKFGSAPTTGSYDCRPYVGGNNETCAMTPTAGTWYVMLRAYSSFSGVSLVATYGSGGVNQLQAGIPTTGLAGTAGQNLFYSVDVPAGAANLIFQMTGPDGDADLYARYGALPTTSTYDCRPYLGGNNESCVMPNATAGTWYVMVRGYSSFSDASLIASYAIAGGNITIPPVPSADVCVATPRENPVLGVLPCPSGGGGECTNFSINQNGSKGAAVITDAATGQYTYTPQGTVWGVDTFSYVANDISTGIPHSALATVIISPRIMPLGDSITAGTNSGNSPAPSVRVGYRKPLYDALQSGGYPVDFVGTMNYGNAVPNFDWDNEGHGGWTSSEILFGSTYSLIQDPSCPTCKLIDWLNAKKPNIVLLHIGTNSFSTNTTSVASILNTINLWSLSPSGNPVAVFLAQIINRNPYQSVDVLAYNQNLSVLVQNRLNAGVGPSTYLVNQESALAYPTDLLADPGGVHPDANGYAKMANRWLTNLTSSGLILKCP